MFTWADDSHVLRVCTSVDTEGSRTFHQILLLSSTPKTSEEDRSTASCVARCRHRLERNGTIWICERTDLFKIICCTREINYWHESLITGPKKQQLKISYTPTRSIETLTHNSRIINIEPLRADGAPGTIDAHFHSPVQKIDRAAVIN